MSEQRWRPQIATYTPDGGIEAVSDDTNAVDQAQCEADDFLERGTYEGDAYDPAVEEVYVVELTHVAQLRPIDPEGDYDGPGVPDSKGNGWCRYVMVPVDGSSASEVERLTAERDALRGMVRRMADGCEIHEDSADEDPPEWWVLHDDRFNGHWEPMTPEQAAAWEALR